MPKILVTGGSGFIGRNLTEQLAGNYHVLAPARTELDLLNEAAVQHYLHTHHPDVVIHAATWNATRNSSKDVSRVLDHNLRMFINLARCRAGFGRFIYYGSGAEYSRSHWQPRLSESCFNAHVPADDYGFSKYLITTCAAPLADTVNLRLFGVFGRYEDWEIRFISNAICKAVWDLPITIRQNVFFDYLHIDDLVKITDWFINHPPRHPAYNVCTGRAVDLLSLAQLVLAASGKHLDIVVSQPGLGREYSGHNSRLLADMGGFHFTDLAQSIDRLYHWYRQNKSMTDRQKLLADK